MSLRISRTILDCIHDGSLENGEFTTMPGFNLQVPTSMTDIDSKILMPVNTWSDKGAYVLQAKKLAE